MRPDAFVYSPDNSCSKAKCIAKWGRPLCPGESLRVTMCHRGKTWTKMEAEQDLLLQIRKLPGCRRSENEMGLKHVLSTWGLHLTQGHAQREQCWELWAQVPILWVCGVTYMCKELAPIPPFSLIPKWRHQHAPSSCRPVLLSPFWLAMLTYYVRCWAHF